MGGFAGKRLYVFLESSLWLFFFIFARGSYGTLSVVFVDDEENAVCNEVSENQCNEVTYTY